MKHLICIRGPPASGKSTISQKICNLFKDDLVILNKDLFNFQIRHKGNLPVNDLLAVMSNFLLSQKISVIIDGLYGGENGQKYISQLKKIAKKNKTKFTLIFLDTEKDKCLQRNNKRKKKIPIKEVHKWYDYLYKSKAEKGTVINTNHISEKETLKRIMKEILTSHY